MSVSEASKKVDGGKLVKVRITETEEGVGVEIVGDFFVYPESGIETVESAVEESLSEGDDTEKAVRREIRDSGIELVGMSPEDIAETVHEATETKTVGTEVDDD